MANPYDVALRQRAVLAYERGEGSYAYVATLFDVHQRTLERWVARWRVAESVEPAPRGGGWHSPIDIAVLRVLVREVPDATVAEMCAEYNRRVRRAHRTSPASFHRALVREGFVNNKNGRGRVRSTGRMWWPSATRS
jgi:transposase-like protein